MIKKKTGKMSAPSFLPPLPHKLESMRGPTGFCSWLIKGQILMGAHPGQLSTQQLVENLTHLIRDASVNLFVCLQSGEQCLVPLVRSPLLLRAESGASVRSPLRLLLLSLQPRGSTHRAFPTTHSSQS